MDDLLLLEQAEENAEPDPTALPAADGVHDYVFAHGAIPAASLAVDAEISDVLALAEVGSIRKKRGATDTHHVGVIAKFARSSRKLTAAEQRVEQLAAEKKRCCNVVQHFKPDGHTMWPVGRRRHEEDTVDACTTRFMQLFVGMSGTKAD